LPLDILIAKIWVVPRHVNTQGLTPLMTEMHPKTAQESKSARPQAAEMSGRLFARISSVVPQAMFPWQWLTGFPGCANLSARPLSMLWIQERRKNCGTRKKAGPLSRGSKATGLPRSPRAFFWVSPRKNYGRRSKRHFRELIHGLFRVAMVNAIYTPANIYAPNPASELPGYVEGARTCILVV